MKEITIKLYQLGELDKEAWESAIAELYDINTTHDWWEDIEEDAKLVGLKLISFDVIRERSCDLAYAESIEKVCGKILGNHGSSCETWRQASFHLAEYNKAYKKDDEAGMIAVEESFLKAIGKAYQVLLRQDLEDRTSEEQIIETIKANEYWFTENGRLYS